MKKRLLASASALTIVITMSTAAPSSSQAAPLQTTAVLIQPYTAQGCSVNTCIYLSTPSGGMVIVQGWAYSTNFYGYFILTAPSGTYYSATQTWLGGKGNYAQWSVSAIIGQYCVTGFTSGGANEGTACESVQ